MKKVFLLLSIFLCLGANDKLKKECDKGNAESCYQLAEFYSQKGGIGTKEGQKYQPLASDYYTKACDLGLKQGCETMGARLLFVGYAFVQAQNPQARDILKDSCLKFSNGESCSLLGMLFLNGDIIKQDKKEAEFFLKKSCDLDSGIGCAELGKLYFKDKNDPFTAFEVFKKSCDLYYATGCMFVGTLYANGKGVLQDYHKSLSYFTKSCDMNDGAGCNGAGLVFQILRYKDKAREYYKKSCELKFQEGCTNYASVNY